MKSITLRKGRDEAVRRRHPWVFSGAIAREEGPIEDGERVAVVAANGERLGTGHYQDGSIKVRLFAFGEREWADDDWRESLQYALLLRRQLELVDNPSTTAYRLVHGEGDGLSGLIIDVYGTTAVLQCHSIGMHRERHLLTEALRQLYGDRLTAVYDKSRATLPPRYAETVTDSYLFGAGEPAIVTENDIRFQVDWEQGQKTGFFLDQRENRVLLGHYSPGRRVLNAFCYTGGFSLYALQAGATWVDSVDSSGRAMEATDLNVSLNGFGPDRHQSHTAEVIHFLRQQEKDYDIVVVDPPAFAKSINKRHNAVQAYKRLNALAMQRIVPGGLLFTFSCSQVVDRELFYNTIVAAGLEVGRPMRILHYLSQGPDHPISLFHPEGGYLKGLVVRMD